MKIMFIIAAVLQGIGLCVKILFIMDYLISSVPKDKNLSAYAMDSLFPTIFFETAFILGACML